MKMQPSSSHPTAALIFEDGAALYGRAVGAPGVAIGEVCFNTAMTGHQEVLTDPSYAGQFVAFTFPHIGIVGANDEDDELGAPHEPEAARGVIMRAPPDAASNWRAQLGFEAWLQRRGIVGVANVDTRALVRRLRRTGACRAIIVHAEDGRFDVELFARNAQDWDGVVGRDWAKTVTSLSPFASAETPWRWGSGYGRRTEAHARVAAVDFGVKRALLNRLNDEGLAVEVAPAHVSADDLLAMDVQGYFLSNGPGDPGATAQYAASVVRALVDSGRPVFGVCLGHQLLAHALGARTVKMRQGHHGANHPVQELTTSKVEIVSMNHEYSVDRRTLPEGVHETHRSLFDGTNCGLALKDKPVFAVQFHPEASPGPQDSFALFKRFAEMCGAAE